MLAIGASKTEEKCSETAEYAHAASCEEALEPQYLYAQYKRRHENEPVSGVSTYAPAEEQTETRTEAEQDSANTSSASGQSTLTMPEKRELKETRHDYLLRIQVHCNYKIIKTDGGGTPGRKADENVPRGLQVARNPRQTEPKSSN